MDEQGKPSVLGFGLKIILFKNKAFKANNTCKCCSRSCTGKGKKTSGRKVVTVMAVFSGIRKLLDLEEEGCSKQLQPHTQAALLCLVMPVTRDAATSA